MSNATTDRRINTDAPIENDQRKREPYERDETPDRLDLRPRGVMRQAHSDVENGLVDTDRRGTPGVEEAVTPHGDGQAHPLPNRGADMRDRPADKRSGG
jgi:hypothetical protein